MWNYTSTNNISLGYLRELASGVAHAYLSMGENPTEALQKTAQSEELTPHHIELVATEVNKAIHAHKYAAIEDKYFAADFPLADAKQVIQGLQLGGDVKIAARFSAPKVPIQELDLFKAFGVVPETLDKTASVKGHLKIAAVKMEHLQQKLQDHAILTKSAQNQAETKFIKTARQVVLESDSSMERLHSIGYIYKFAKEAKYVNTAKPALAKLAYVLGREGKLEPKHVKLAMNYFMSKEADQKAPTELISENLLDKAMIINGEHPLYITLKTLDDCHRDAFVGDKLSLVEDKLQAVRQKIREL
jgi:hypothetical protein